MQFCANFFYLLPKRRQIYEFRYDRSIPCNHHCNRFYSYQKCEPFLIGGSIAGAVFLYRQNFLPQWVTILENVMSSEAYLILVCGLFGSIIALLTASKGNYGFSKLVSRLCNTERKTL